MIPKKYILIASSFLFKTVYCQTKDSCIILDAYRHSVVINPATNKKEEFSLCGEFIHTDTMNFFTMIYGCEANVSALVSRYTLRNDSLNIIPFDFLLEPAFLKVIKKESKDNIQTLVFKASNGQPVLAHSDSSWLIRLIKGRKTIIKDFTGNGIVSIERNNFDAIELLQLTKIFGVPIVLFLNKKYDYEITINQPLETLNRKLGIVGTQKGFFSLSKEFNCFENCLEQFKVTKKQKYVLGR